MGIECSKPMEPVLLPSHKRRFAVKRSHSFCRHPRSASTSLGQRRYHQESYFSADSSQSHCCAAIVAVGPPSRTSLSNPLHSNTLKAHLAAELLVECQRRLKLVASPLSTRCVSVTFECPVSSSPGAKALPSSPSRGCIDEFDCLQSVTASLGHG